jgi:hypothetical protein
MNVAPPSPLSSPPPSAPPSSSPPSFAGLLPEDAESSSELEEREDPVRTTRTVSARRKLDLRVQEEDVGPGSIVAFFKQITEEEAEEQQRLEAKRSRMGLEERREKSEISGLQSAAAKVARIRALGKERQRRHREKLKAEAKAEAEEGPSQVSISALALVLTRPSPMLRRPSMTLFVLRIIKTRLQLLSCCVLIGNSRRMNATSLVQRLVASASQRMRLFQLRKRTGVLLILHR